MTHRRLDVTLDSRIELGSELLESAGRVPRICFGESTETFSYVEQSVYNVRSLYCIAKHINLCYAHIS